MLHFLIYDVLGTPAILVGLFSLIGLLLQKKGISDVISGTLKTIIWRRRLWRCRHRAGSYHRNV